MEAERFAFSILENLHDGVYFVDGQRTIRYWNRAASEITGFSSEEVLGRHCFDNILQHVDGAGCALCESHCPLVRTMSDGRKREVQVYLRHKSGHRVPVQVRASPMLDADGAIVGAVEIFSDAVPRTREAERVAELEDLSRRDALTGLANRRQFDLLLESRLDDLRRFGWPLGLLMVDIDHFKRCNDEHGHLVGDRVLKAVASTLALAVRSTDVVARFGGEEFAVLSCAATDRDLAGLGERLRALVESSSVEIAGRRLAVSISIGAAQAQEREAADELIARADAALYEAKSAGRNRVVCATPAGRRGRIAVA
ncbi:MAG: sensor domain-containing diguanylate cyclase [Thermoanaerobaculia bacterium]|nr:sensor domain-containing diguanylate cyclase [Thermoanaerobaculia bacterium]